MNNKTEETSSLRLNIPKHIHREIKSHCAKIGKKNQDWLVDAIVSAYENEIEKGGDNGK